MFRLNAGAVNAGPTSNFKRLALARTELYRHQIKTPGSYPIGLDSDLDMGGGFYEALRAPKRGNMFL